MCSGYGDGLWAHFIGNDNCLHIGKELEKRSLEEVIWGLLGCGVSCISFARWHYRVGLTVLPKMQSFPIRKNFRSPALNEMHPFT